MAFFLSVIYSSKFRDKLNLALQNYLNFNSSTPTSSASKILASESIVISSSLSSSRSDNVIMYYLNDYWINLGDAKTKEFPFLESGPWKIIAIIFCYLYFIALSYPRFHDNKLIDDQNRYQRPSLSRRSSFNNHQDNESMSISEFNRADANAKVPFVILLNGLLLGLNGAWFLIGFLISSFGQTLMNPIFINADAKAIEFYSLLRLYFSCLFLSFQIIVIFISILIIYSSKSFECVGVIEISEQVALPVLIYVLIKFKYYDLILFTSLITTLIGFISNCYSTLNYADALDSINEYGSGRRGRHEHDHDNDGNMFSSWTSKETLGKVVSFLKVSKYVFIYYLSIFYLVLTSNYSYLNHVMKELFNNRSFLNSIFDISTNYLVLDMKGSNFNEIRNETPIVVKLLPVIYSSSLFLISWFSVSRMYFNNSNAVIQ